MNTPKISRSRKPAHILAGSIAAFAALMLAPTGQAGLTWDVTAGDGAVLTDGTGTWSVGTPNWNVGGVDQNWTDGNDAIFGGGASGTAGAVTVGGTVVPANITFNTPFAGNYTLNGGTISLGAAGTDITNNAVGTTTINSNIAVTADQLWTTGLGATLAVGGNINDGGSVWVNNTVEKAGVGTLRLTGSANVFGAFKVTGGTLDLLNTNITLNKNNGEGQNSDTGLLIQNASANLRGNSVLITNKNNINIKNTSHFVMSDNANIDMGALTAEGGDWHYNAIGGFAHVEAGSSWTMKDNAYVGSYSDPARTIKTAARDAGWLEVSGNGVQNSPHKTAYNWRRAAMAGSS
jgi:hypothetical protein